MSTPVIRHLSCAAALLLLTASVTLAQQNEVAFDNKSGEPALVKVIGHTPRETHVPVGGTATVRVSPGNYHIKVRYGAEGKYRYTRGEEFEVTESATTRSRISITLHKVPDGNYETEPIAADDFDSAPSVSRDSIDLAGLKPGPWHGRTETDQGFLAVSFAVDPGNLLVTKIATKGGMTGVPGWTWPTKNDISAKIQRDGSFSYKDGWGNLIRGRFSSTQTAEGEVPASFSTKGPDGQVIRPPSRWTATPMNKSPMSPASKDITQRYRWKTGWSVANAANGITVTDTEVLPDGKRRQSFSGSIPIVNNEIVTDAPGSRKPN